MIFLLINLIITVIAIYLSYLYLNKSYERTRYDHNIKKYVFEEGDRCKYTVIIHLSMYAVCLIPLINIITAIFVIIDNTCEHRYVDSFLYKEV